MDEGKRHQFESFGTTYYAKCCGTAINLSSRWTESNQLPTEANHSNEMRIESQLKKLQSPVMATTIQPPLVVKQ